MSLYQTVYGDYFNNNNNKRRRFGESNGGDVEIPPVPDGEEIVLAPEAFFPLGNWNTIFHVNWNLIDMCTIVAVINQFLFTNQTFSQAMADLHKRDVQPSVINIPMWFLKAMMFRGHDTFVNDTYLKTQLLWLEERRNAGKMDFWYRVYVNWSTTTPLTESEKTRSVLEYFVTVRDFKLNPDRNKGSRIFQIASSFPFAVPFPESGSAQSKQRSASISYITTLFKDCSPYVDPFWPDSSTLAIDYYVPFLTTSNADGRPGLLWPPPPITNSRPTPTGHYGPTTGSTGATGGHSGPSGPSGTTGGHSGPSGPSGTTGGHSGPSGPSGTTGGHSGPSGPSGSSGPTGSRPPSPSPPPPSSTTSTEMKVIVMSVLVIILAFLFISR